MNKFAPIVASIALLSMPASAADWRSLPEMTRPSGFAGARVKLSLGGTSKTPLSAQLTIAPARSSVTDYGMVRTDVGEGVGLELAGAKPTLMIAGRSSQELAEAKRKMGVSTVGWVAIGVGVAAAVVGGLYLWEATHPCRENGTPCD
jgi:hypothetical protein